RNELRVGLALGSGAARGWAHIGVIQTLERHGISPDIVCGTSIGALVGATMAAGELERLDKWVRTLSWQKVISYFDLTMTGGLIKGQKLFDFFREHIEDSNMEDLDRPFGAIATDLASGREIWMREGSVFDAVRASISLPGLFTPVERDEDLLVDGGLVNPIPVSMCRAMGAHVVIAVDLNADLLSDVHHGHAATAVISDAPADESTSLLDRIQARLSAALSLDSKDHDTPSMIDVVTASINIMQVRITRSRLAGEPADALISPRLAQFALLDFHRASEAIEEGEAATERAMPQIKSLLGR
ncbi:MAG TPA: patatin-like phospholipase RssA, partial [Burkholderiales bacterium]|nr:patatin-like phospholipase RssA [Burkholderiales bacterium]